MQPTAIRCRRAGWGLATIAGLLVGAIGCGAGEDGGAAPDGSTVDAPPVGAADAQEYVEAEPFGDTHDAHVEAPTDAAVDGSGAPDTNGPGPADTVVTADPADTAGVMGVEGVLRDEDENVLSYASIAGCTATSCFVTATDADGRFMCAIAKPVDIVLKTFADLEAAPRLGVAVRPVRFDTVSTNTVAGLVQVGEIYVPTLPVGAPIGPKTSDVQTFAVGDGVELALRTADLVPLVGKKLSDLAARVIPEGHWPPFPGLEDETVVAVVALHPFATTSTSPVAVRIPSQLPSGTPVWFRTVSEIDGHLSTPVAGVADGGAVATVTGVGIVELTWLVVSRAPPL